MTPKAYPDGLDCVWLALDRHDHVGAFVTAGAGPIPRHALDDERFDVIEDRVVELHRVSAARMLVSLPRPDSFVEIAERGLFVYDWSDVHRVAVNEIHAYELTAAPDEPITVDQLPQDLAAVAARLKLGDASFRDTVRLDVRHAFQCVEKSWR